MKERIILLIWKGLIIFHLSSILLYTARVIDILPSNRISGPISQVVTLYSKLTMGPYRFAFFAPSIPGWYSIKIYGKTKDGKVYEYKLPRPNREIEIRYNRMLRNIREERLRVPMLQSIANYVKRKHPEVDSVNLHVFHTDTPTLEDFRLGKRKNTELAYNLMF